MFHRILEVSELSALDRATLSAGYYYYADERLNCGRARETMATRFKDPGDLERAVSARFGCRTSFKTPKYVIDGVEFYSCLCNFIHPLLFPYLEIMDRMDKGILPDHGAYLDQPAQALEAVQLLSRLKLEVQQAEQAREQKAKNNGRK